MKALPLCPQLGDMESQKQFDHHVYAIEYEIIGDIVAQYLLFDKEFGARDCQSTGWYLHQWFE
jgi:hypothetical protein